MKKLFCFTAVASMLISFAAGAQESLSGTVSYALPQTSLVFDVQAVQESFYAGPYAKFAQKYLGVQARTENETSCHLTEVKLKALVEADPSGRYTVALSKTTPCPALLQMTAQGLIATSDGNFGEEAVWRFTAPSKADFSGKGVSSNYTSQATTLYKKDDVSFNKVSVQQNMIVEKSLEKKAQEAADMIFKLRQTRVNIVTGDTDANYSGEAMASALAELAALEEEYLSLFVGYSDYQNVSYTAEVIPSKADQNNMSIAFRLSDTDGIVDADYVGGKPYIVKIEPQNVTPASQKGGSGAKASVIYRIPAICTVKLMEGAKTILQTRVPVYQLGVDTTYPLF